MPDDDHGFGDLTAEDAELVRRASRIAATVGYGMRDIVGRLFVFAVLKAKTDESCFADVLALTAGSRGLLLPIKTNMESDVWDRAAAAALEVLRAEPGFHDAKDSTRAAGV